MIPTNSFGFLEAEQAWFAIRMAYLCRTFNGSETSGVRSPKRNLAKGGAADSLHLIGLAKDVIFDTPADQINALETAGSLGLHFKTEPDHVHFQSRPVRPKTRAA